MGKRKRILLVGSQSFAQGAATLLEACADVDLRWATHVTIDLFLGHWRPDLAIINWDALEGEPLADIEALGRFRPKVTIVLVSFNSGSHLASLVSAVLLPSELDSMLAALVTSLFSEAPTCLA